MIKKLQKRLKKFLKTPENIRTASLIGLLAITAAIPLTVYIAQKQQEIRQHAADDCAGGYQNAQGKWVIRFSPASYPTLQAAVDCLDGKGGGILYLPEGTYDVDVKTKLYDNMTVMGDGMDKTIIRIKPGLANPFHILYNSGTTNITIRDLTVQGLGKNKNKGEDGDVCCHGIKLESITNAYIINVLSKDNGLDGFYLGSLSPENVVGDGVVNSRVSGSKAIGNNRNGLSVMQGKNNIIDNSTFDNNTQNGLLLSINRASLSGFNITGNRIIGSSASNNDDSAFGFAACSTDQVITENAFCNDTGISNHKNNKIKECLPANGNYFINNTPPTGAGDVQADSKVDSSFVNKCGLPLPALPSRPDVNPSGNGSPTPTGTLTPTPTNMPVTLQIGGSSICISQKPALHIVLPTRGMKAGDYILFNPALSDPAGQPGDLTPYIKNNEIDFYEGYPFNFVHVNANIKYQIIYKNFTANEQSNTIEVTTRNDCGPASPTLTPTKGVTPTQPKTPTILSVSVTLPGIGKDGNKNPNNATRNIIFQLFNGGQKVGSDINGKVSFDAESGTFTGTINMGTIVQTGSYIAKIKMDQSLSKAFASTSVTAGVTTTLPPVMLITGDMNNDNKLDMLDFNILASCFGKKSDSETCADKKVDADSNDDGMVDGIDYNLFLTGLKKGQKGE